MMDISVPGGWKMRQIEGSEKPSLRRWRVRLFLLQTLLGKRDTSVALEFGGNSSFSGTPECSCSCNSPEPKTGGNQDFLYRFMDKDLRRFRDPARPIFPDRFLQHGGYWGGAYRQEKFEVRSLMFEVRGGRGPIARNKANRSIADCRFRIAD